LTPRGTASGEADKDLAAFVEKHAERLPTNDLVRLATAQFRASRSTILRRLREATAAQGVRLMSPRLVRALLLVGACLLFGCAWNWLPVLLLIGIGVWSGAVPGLAGRGGLRRRRLAAHLVRAEPRLVPAVRGADRADARPGRPRRRDSHPEAARPRADRAARGTHSPATGREPPPAQPDRRADRRPSRRHSTATTGCRRGVLRAGDVPRGRTRANDE
jgi:hypothetical protein